MVTPFRRELAEAIADNIVLVAISKSAWDMRTGDLYRERLPKAVEDVTRAHGFDHSQFHAYFRIW
eukprot:1162078-Amphidinium_carterae.1